MIAYHLACTKQLKAIKSILRQNPAKQKTVSMLENIEKCCLFVFPNTRIAFIEQSICLASNKRLLLLLLLLLQASTTSNMCYYAIAESSKHEY